MSGTRDQATNEARMRPPTTLYAVTLTLTLTNPNPGSRLPSVRGQANVWQMDTSQSLLTVRHVRLDHALEHFIYGFRFTQL